MHIYSIIFLGFISTMTTLPAKKEAQYVSIERLVPSQIRYSSHNVARKQQLAPEECLYDQNQSIYDLSDAIPVIKVSEHFVVQDGHHSVLVSISRGAKTMPIHIAFEYSGTLDDTFWDWAHKQEHAYLFMPGSNLISYPTSFDALIDDPIRYFVAIVARKYSKDLSHDTSSGAEFPLWIKIGKDIPFIEFKIADILYQHGFHYSYGDEKDSLEKLIEEARLMLMHHQIPNLKLLTEREHFLSSKQIENWISNIF